MLNTLDRGGVPERDEDYGAQVWSRIRFKLSRRPEPRIPWLTWGAIAAMFIASASCRLSDRGGRLPAPTHPKASDKGVKERILLVALTDHFERSQMVLAEIENAEARKNGSLDVSFERSQAEDLLGCANRLYRLTAVANGNTAAASLLDDLERVLVDITHAPEKVNREQIEALRGRIEDQGLTFKVKVFSTGMVNQAKERL